jgi:ribosome-associated protein
MAEREGSSRRPAGDAGASAAPRGENAIDLGPGAWVDPGGLVFTFTRSRGPGGQAVNKLASRARLRVRVIDIRGLDEAAAARLRALAGSRLVRDDVLSLDADTFRGQRENRRACLERLSALVQRAMVPPTPRRRKRITKAMKASRMEAKRRTSGRKRERRWRGEND